MPTNIDPTDLAQFRLEALKLVMSKVDQDNPMACEDVVERSAILSDFIINGKPKDQDQ